MNEIDFSFMYSSNTDTKVKFKTFLNTLNKYNVETFPIKNKKQNTKNKWWENNYKPMANYSSI